MMITVNILRTHSATGCGNRNDHQEKCWKISIPNTIAVSNVADLFLDDKITEDIQL